MCFCAGLIENKDFTAIDSERLAKPMMTIESLEPAVDTMSNIANLSHHHFRIPTTTPTMPSSAW